MHGLYFVYLLTNHRNTVLYAGVTRDLKRRVYEHKTKRRPGFTSKYSVTKVVYYEASQDIRDAIRREKQIKAGSRQRKLNLIEKMNPDWRDLYEEI